jgi:hypothetical protein
MVMKVIIVNGYPQSGKDTFCEFASTKYDCITYSTIDTVKEIATMMGWDGTKTPENRAMLSALKDFTTEWFDMTFKEMTSLVGDEMALFSRASYLNSRISGCVDFIFLHIREPKEISRMKDWCTERNIKCYLLCIQRREMIGEQSNHADSNVYFIQYDSYLNNNGNLDDFKITSLEYLESLKNGDIDKWMNINE